MSALRTHLIPSQPTLVAPPPPAFANAQWAGSFKPDQQVQAGLSSWQRASQGGPSSWAASFDSRQEQVVPARVQQYPTSQIPLVRQQFQPTFTPSYSGYMPTSTHHHQLHSEMISHAPHSQEIDQQSWPTAADFDLQSGSTQVEEAREATEMEEPLPEVNWQDDAPADLANVLRFQPTIPEVVPLRPGATQETIPRNGQLNYSDQSALLMSDPTSTRRKSVHFRETSGVPSSLEEALAQSSTTIPGIMSSWEDPLVTDLSDFDEDAFMAFNGQRGVALDHRIGVGDLEGWGEMQKDWEELQRTSLPPLTKEELRGADGRYLFQSRNPYAQEEMRGVQNSKDGRESPTIHVSLVDG